VRAGRMARTQALIRAVGLVVDHGRALPGPGASDGLRTEEAADLRQHRAVVVHQEEMALAAGHQQPGARDVAGQQQRVGQRHDGIVVAGQDQGLGRQLAQPGERSRT
jgi:hypothetical protein